MLRSVNITPKMLRFSDRKFTTIRKVTTKTLENVVTLRLLSTVFTKIGNALAAFFSNDNFTIFPKYWKNIPENKGKAVIFRILLEKFLIGRPQAKPRNQW